MITLERDAPVKEDDPQAAGPIDLMTAVLGPENFDRWLFSDELSEGDRRRHLEDILDAKLGIAVFRSKLNYAQTMKLHLAGKGDIKRFFDQIAERKNLFEVERRDFNSGCAALFGLDPISELYQKGPFGDGSLFAKTLKRIKDDKKAGR